VRQSLVSAWNRRGALALLLWPLSVLYGALTATRKYLYRKGVLRVHELSVPVVVVGNVIAGGAGKTPVVMALVQHLQSRGLKVGVVSRGYGRHSDDCREVLADSAATDAGDEPILIKRTTHAPVFVATARIDAARALMRAYPDVGIVVCDDGLQHLGLHRDIEICVFDERGTGNGFLLPAGPLREPWPRATDLVLAPANLTEIQGFSLRRELADEALRSDGTSVALKELWGPGKPADAPLWAVAGIARPEVFFAMLRARGLQLARAVALPDHSEFDGHEWSVAGTYILLCTEKDAVKLWRHRPDALAVPLVLQIDSAFWHAFDALLQAATKAKLSSVHGHTTS
jgi:tetraacyldisaccharide 4'-kinase